SPLMKIVSRGDTTVVDAYLSPVLRRYVEQFSSELSGSARIMFMQSNGGLTDARLFQGKDCILSGPAGGIVGAVAISKQAGFDKIITFDMGGTSTDVAHFAGEFERSFDTEVAGVRMRAPMMNIHTVAAGGGSILHFDGIRFRVGPDSAGANPGPCSYRRGGPLCVTDANLMLGRIPVNHFPKVFGPLGNLSLDLEAVRRKFQELAAEIHRSTDDRRSPEQIAEGFLAVAVENMANAIKRISVQRGYNVANYTLCCFGAAAGQHACKVADALGIERILIHRYAGVLSAYGMGLADIRVIHDQAVESLLTARALEDVEPLFEGLEARCREELFEQSVGEDRIETIRKLHIRYQGTDTPLLVDYGSLACVTAAFEEAHRQRFGFSDPTKKRIIEALSVEMVGKHGVTQESREVPSSSGVPEALERIPLFSGDRFLEAPVYLRDDLSPGTRIEGPAIIIEPTATTVIEAEWQGDLTDDRQLVLTRSQPLIREFAIGTRVDPVMLEIFNKRFMAIAEQMGYTLQNTAVSVNIKERLDFSCALFDAEGRLIANAPHIPVHLGSMDESVQALIAGLPEPIREGEVYLLNSPFHGGTHLPDITVVTPVFERSGQELLFYVASRGHHADIGGSSPGSMPPDSRTIDEEGQLSGGLKLVEAGLFREAEVLDWLSQGPFPARNPRQNIADLKAQVAANEKGLRELLALVDEYGRDTVAAYMGHIQDHAEEAVRRVIEKSKSGHYCLEMDNGAMISVEIRIDPGQRRATIDFHGTSAQQADNFNAPKAVVKAAVLYVFRTLVADDIPLNAGCLRPIEIVIPKGSLLHPTPPAAVVAGNVETSQCIVDALYGALGVLAGSQGTMNNLTFGNANYQYYETICGGSGAGPGFDGTDAVHTHMTNSRITDPEVLESRYPVRLEEFSIRPESGGLGRYRGGNGVVRKIRFLEKMTAAILSGFRRHRPAGLAGGNPGKEGRNRIERADGSTIEIGSCARSEVQPGDRIIIETPGGGGFGKPGEGTDQ
ncbi:MAG: hydantoinase B/oxoprolinase family protein, partial [Gammaproteobacteria bacterium]